MAKKINEKANAKVISDIIKSEMMRNQDGFGLLTDRGYCVRTLNKEKFTDAMNISIPECTWVVAHARYATKGAVTISNVHLWELEKFYFAHNGIISKYHRNFNRLEECESDSLQYFKALIKSIKNLDKMHIAKRIRKSEFFDGGRAILVDPEKKMYLFGDFKVYEYKGWLIVSSCSITVGNKKEVNYGDLKIHKNNFSNGSLNGIYLFDPDETRFEKLGKLPEKSYSEFHYTNYFTDDTPPPEFASDFPFKKYQIGMDM